MPRQNCIIKIPKERKKSFQSYSHEQSLGQTHPPRYFWCRHEAASLCNTIFATRGGRWSNEIVAAGYSFSMHSAVPSLSFFFFYLEIHEREISRAVARNFRSNGRNRRPRVRDQDILFAIDTLSMIARLISNVNRAFLRPGEYSRRRDGRQNYGEHPRFAIFDRRYQQLATLLQLLSK